LGILKLVEAGHVIELVLNVYIGLMWLSVVIKDRFEDVKVVIRSRKSKKKRQYNGQNNKDKRTNNYAQNTKRKTKDYIIYIRHVFETG